MLLYSLVEALVVDDFEAMRVFVFDIILKILSMLLVVSMLVFRIVLLCPIDADFVVLGDQFYPFDVVEDNLGEMHV